MNNKNQKKAIAFHLKEYGNITSLDAIREYGVTRLSSIIYTLRNEGWIIISEPITRKNRFGNSVTLAKYVFKNTFAW